MSTSPRPPRPRPRRSYPPTAYLPFALLVLVPLAVLVAIIVLLTHLFSPPPAHRSGTVPPRATATTTATAIAATATRPASAPIGKATATATRSAPTPQARVTVTRTVAPGPVATATRTAIPIPLATATHTPPPVATRPVPRPVTIARGATPAGAPVGAATVFHRRPATLWAFAVIPNVRAGDHIRFVWHDLNKGTTIADFTYTATGGAALYHARAYAYPGNKRGARSFAPGSYRVDVFHDGALVAAGGFSIAPS